MILRALFTLCLAICVDADLRMASHPREGYRLTNQGTVHWNITPWNGQLHYRYMEPSTFGYKGLEHQKRRNYDNFLRSNIDNEQDNRNFNDEAGRDHLPFRTQEGKVYDEYIRHFHSRRRRIKQVPESILLTKVVKPGESMAVPLRWNNPHSSEMEVNIWIFEHASKQPIVVPIRKPSCSGEGYQDNVISFTVPKDFAGLGGKIPGFKGCNADTKVKCTLQIYAHSVESRTYAIGFPIVIPGHDKSLTASDSKGIQAASQDPWLDLTALRDTCLPATDPSATISAAMPRWARLVSDVYNHAYQNSDYSPYSGQQHERISKNLQASAINKMEVGNRGELGKSILPRETSQRLAYLRRLEDRIYKNYESLANKIIKSIGGQMKTTGKVGVQPLATCFRCSEVGSTNTKRLETNTYIPSFQLPEKLVAAAKELVPSKYSGLITESGLVQIYVAALNDLLPFFYKSRHLGIIYQDAIVKSTVGTMSDATKFKKRNEKGAIDGGKYAALEAKKMFIQERGCPSECLWPTIQEPLFPPQPAPTPAPTPALVKMSDSKDVSGGTGSEEQDGGAKQPKEYPQRWALKDGAKLGGRWIRGEKLITLKASLGGSTWIVGLVDGKWLKMVEIEITGEKTYRWIDTRYTSARGSCTKQATFTVACFNGRHANADAYKVIPPFVQTQGVESDGSLSKAGAWFCVANLNKNRVSKPFSDLNSAKKELSKTSGSSRNPQMICEMGKESGAKSDPHRVGGQNQGAGTRAGFSKYWRNWNDIKAMNRMCNSNDMCRYKGDLPEPDPRAWFCVARYDQKKVLGPFPDVDSAKEELNKSPGKRGNSQMICEMTKDGPKQDPHIVGGQNQGGGPANGFQKFWHNGHWIKRMNDQCKYYMPCKFNMDKKQIAKPLVAESLATSVHGKCAPCAQFFGKKVHVIKRPPVTKLAAEVTKSGSPSNVADLADNPDNYQFDSHRRRRRTSLIQKDEKHKRKSKKRRHLKKVRDFMEQADLEESDTLMLKVLDDVKPLPEVDDCH